MFSKKVDWRQFFFNIAESFGYDKNVDKDMCDFYNKIYFGNYVDVICGIGDNSIAENVIWKNRDLYNEDLFDFCNKNDIDIIICFSKRVYNALPKLDIDAGESESEVSIGKIGEKNNLLGEKHYKKDTHNDRQIALNRNIEVYGIRHSTGSGGYKVEQVRDYMYKIKALHLICK